MEYILKKLVVLSIKTVAGIIFLTIIVLNAVEIIMNWAVPLLWRLGCLTNSLAEKVLESLPQDSHEVEKEEPEVAQFNEREVSEHQADTAK